MAYFIRDTGSNLTPVQHSFEIFKQYSLNNYFSTLTGRRGSGNPIIVDDSLFKGKGAGDVGRYHFIPQYEGEGIDGQNPSITGNEKSLDEFYMDLRIDQVAQAFKKKGKMTDMRTIWNYREEFRNQLAEWFRDRTEKDIVDALTGYITDGVTRTTDTTKLVNGSGRCFRVDNTGSTYTLVETDANGASDESLKTNMAATDKMNTYALDELQSLAKTAGKYPMKPVRARNNEEYYILVLHPRAAIELRRDERWEKRAIASLTGRGSLESDPIATGAIGVWEHIIVKEAEKIKTVSGDGFKVARNLLLGAEAAVLAYGQTLDYKEESRDYGREMGVAADEIRGCRKLVFDGCDMNVMQVPCAI